MKTDKELLKIHDNKENSPKDFWVYEKLTTPEKMRLFELLTIRMGVGK